MMPTMMAPAYWKSELLNIPDVREETLKMVSISLGSPLGLICNSMGVSNTSGSSMMMMISLGLITKNCRHVFTKPQPRALHKSSAVHTRIIIQCQ